MCFGLPSGFSAGKLQIDLETKENTTK